MRTAINLKGFVQGPNLFHHDLLLNLHRLGNHGKLVMGHNDTVVIIILHAVEERLTVREVLGSSIQQTIIGIGSLIGGSNLADIGLHTDNDWLVGKTKTLHFMCCNTHDKGLTCTHFMVTDTTAIL